jgi:2,4-dienoyl-CoA reductase-like NADH-dependent reductase (Old Yellow Enzyme family)
MKLFEQYSLGDLRLRNRIVMAPMTRNRAVGNLPNDLMVEYYRQRASAGLIITEAWQDRHPPVAVQHIQRHGRAALAAGYADLAAFARAFLANPDLPGRLQNHLPLNTPIPETFYSGGEKGYIDYPALV